MPFPPPGTQIPFTLSDGTEVVLRPLEASDRERLAEGLKQLSARSRLTRFFGPVTTFSERQLRYLTEVDQERHVAWAALRGEEGLGVARFAREPDDSATAEPAVTVIDAYQHRGLGTVLFALLYLSAQRLGVKRFRALVLFENQELVRALHEAGGRLGAHEEGAVRIEIPVFPTVDDLPDTPAGRFLAQLLRRLEAALSDLGH